MRPRRSFDKPQCRGKTHRPYDLPRDIWRDGLGLGGRYVRIYACPRGRQITWCEWLVLPSCTAGTNPIRDRDIGADRTTRRMNEAGRRQWREGLVMPPPWSNGEHGLSEHAPPLGSPSATIYGCSGNNVCWRPTCETGYVSALRRRPRQWLAEHDVSAACTLLPNQSC